MKLIIATKNKSKYTSVKSLVLSVLNNKHIDITQIASNIPSVKETGKSSRENCLIKINHYKKYIDSPFIVIDDKVEFFGAKYILNFNHKFHELGSGSDKNPIDIFKFMQDYLQKNKNIKMVRTRYFGLVNEKSKQILTSKIRAKLTPLDNKSYKKILSQKMLDNPLNYFSIPNGYKNRLSVYNTKKRIGIVYNKSVQEKFRQFLIKL
jgi:hypothetical protein